MLPKEAVRKLKKLCLQGTDLVLIIGMQASVWFSADF